MTAAVDRIQTIGSTQARIFTPATAERCGPTGELTEEWSWGYDCIDFLETVCGWELLPYQRWLYIHALEKGDNQQGFRYKIIVILVARQNGKTKWLKGLGLWRLFMDKYGRSSGSWPAARLAVIAAQNLDYAESMLKEVVDEVRDNRLLSPELLNHRECLAIDTAILTPNGWKTMATLDIGDEVYHPDGHPVVVDALSPVHVGRDCYRVSTTDGRTVVADANHLWTVYEHKNDRWVTLTTREMVSRGVLTRPGDYRYRLPRQQAIISKPVDLPIDPYLLGAWLGDGYHRGAELAVGAQDLAEMNSLIGQTGARIVSVRRDSRGSSSVVRFSTGPHKHGFQTACTSLGIWGNKRIPTNYLTAGTEQRLSLLQGLLDTDGSISKTGQVEFCAMRKALAEQVVDLSRSLGFAATLRTGRAIKDGHDYGEKYRVCFSPLQSQANPFRLQRKAVRVTRTSKQNTFSIKSIDPVDSVPVRCISVNRDDGLFVAGAGLIPTHNTNGKHRMILTNRRNWRAATASRRGARSLSVDIAMLDELREHTTWDAWRAIVPTTTTRSFSQVVCCSNAGDQRSEVLRAQRDACVRRIKNGETKETQMGFFEWSVPNEVDPHDPGYWYLANPAMGLLNDFTLDDLRGYLEAMEYRDMPGFQTEHLCQWVDALEPGVMPAEHWSETMDHTSHRDPDASVVAAVDINYNRTRGYVAIAARRPDGNVHIEIVAAAAGTEWIIPWFQERKGKFTHTVIQKTGSPISGMIDEFVEAGIDVTEVNSGVELAGAFGSLYDGIVEHGIYHRPALVLDRAAASAVARNAGEQMVFDRRNSPVDASPLVACSLAVYIEANPPGATVPTVHEWPDEDEIEKWQVEADKYWSEEESKLEEQEDQ